MKEYLIKTEHIGLRNWLPSDLDPYTHMCQDPEVMKYFPAGLTRKEAEHFIHRMQTHFTKYGFCYFAADLLKSDEFIGFVGILHQNYKSDYTPCVDIGWRLKRSVWGKGYATEAAEACLKFAFSKMNVKEIYSFATIDNTGSENIMKKIGMEFISTFDHPYLKDHPEMKECVVYNIQNKNL